MKRNNIFGNRFIELVVIPYRTPRWSRNIKKIARALGSHPVFSEYKQITGTWNMYESTKAVMTLSRNTTLKITNTEETGSGSLLFNPKGYTLTLPSNSKMKAEFNDRILADDFQMPTSNQYHMLEFIYINKVFRWSLSVYEDLTVPVVPLDGIVSDLLMTTVAGGVRLSWNTTTTNQDGYEIWYAADGVNYVELDTSVAQQYDLVGYPVGLYRVRAYKGTILGDFCESQGIMTFSATTAGAATVTLQRLDVVAGGTISIDWGDTTITTHTNDGVTRTRAYAGAGTYAINVINTKNISNLQFQDNQLLVNSSMLLTCGDNLARVYLDKFSGVGSVINSADMAHLKLTTELFLYFSPAGTYTINSDHFKAYTLNTTLLLYFSQAGTYTINSDHFKAYTLTQSIRLTFLPVGTYTINSDHFKAYTLNTTLILEFIEEGTYTISTTHFKAYTVTTYALLFNTTGLTRTIARADFTLYRVTTYIITMGITATDADNILLGIYDAFPLKTSTGGLIELNGVGNTSPTGLYQAMIPPTTGKEAAYELINDSGGVSALHWATIEVVGGGTP